MSEPANVKSGKFHFAIKITVILIPSNFFKKKTFQLLSAKHFHVSGTMQTQQDSTNFSYIWNFFISLSLLSLAEHSLCFKPVKMQRRYTIMLLKGRGMILCLNYLFTVQFSAWFEACISGLFKETAPWHTHELFFKHDFYFTRCTLIHLVILKQ